MVNILPCISIGSGGWIRTSDLWVVEPNPTPTNLYQKT